MTRQTRVHERWAHLRFSVIGQLLAAPPLRGELKALLRALSQRTWQLVDDLNGDRRKPKGAPSVGAGETPIIALAPAIAGAVFRATGRRVRSLPIERALTGDRA